LRPSLLVHRGAALARAPRPWLLVPRASLAAPVVRAPLAPVDRERALTAAVRVQTEPGRLHAIQIDWGLQQPGPAFESARRVARRRPRRDFAAKQPPHDVRVTRRERENAPVAPVGQVSSAQVCGTGWKSRRPPPGLNRACGLRVLEARIDAFL